MGSAVAAAVEAVGADLALGQPDCFDNVFERAETERAQTETTADFFNEAVVLGRTGARICFEVGVVVAFKIGDNPACDQFEFAF